MCNDRERLIGFVYDECDARERREIEAHLSTCEDCREEIGGLRGTRQDLLAWDVPPHDSVWRPFVSPRVAPSWREVPVWALAAAASVMLVTGAAGGAATQMYLARGDRGPAVASSASNIATRSDAAQVLPASASAADLAALERRVLAAIEQRVDASVRAEIARVSLATSHQPTTRLVAANGLSAGSAMVSAEDVRNLGDQVRALQSAQWMQGDVNLGLNKDIANLMLVTSQLKSALAQASTQQALQASR